MSYGAGWVEEDGVVSAEPGCSWSQSGVRAQTMLSGFWGAWESPWRSRSSDVRAGRQMVCNFPKWLAHDQPSCTCLLCPWPCETQDPPRCPHPLTWRPFLCPPPLFSALVPQESVALLLKQPALIGLDASELRARLSGLAAAVGCEPAKAVRLASHSANLIMLHPDYVKVSITNVVCN